MTIVTRPVSTSNVVTGIALILLPLISIAVKLIAPGWMMVILFFYAGIFLAAGYVFLVVIAATGFFGRRAAFSFVNPARARIAGWVHGVSVVLFMFFLVDGGDTGTWSSGFVTVFNLDVENPAVAGSAEPLTAAFLFLGLGAYIWLIVEWIIALRAKRRLV